MTAPAPGRVEKALAEFEFAPLGPDSPTEAWKSGLEALVASLHGATALETELAKRGAAAVLTGRDVPNAARLIAAAFAGNGNGPKPEKPQLQGQAVLFADPEPWPEPVDGAALLDGIQQFIIRYVGLPAGADSLLAAFVLYSYAVDRFLAATYVVAHSPTPQCGKTRLLEVLELLLWRPWRTVVLSTAVIFRVLEEHAPALLLDEAEVVSGRTDAASDVKALLQAGYRRGVGVPRCVGENNEVRIFRPFGPKVFALIGALPPALFDRCIPIEMERRQRSDSLQRFRPTRVEAEALVLRRQARRWAIDNGDALGSAEVPLIETLSERAEEVWEPILACGMVAGGGWFERLQDAALRLSAGVTTPSVGVELLADIRGIFDSRGADRLFSADLASALNALEGRPWADWGRGQGLTTNKLARQLQAFRVSPGTVRLGEQTAKGYKREQFEEAWSRYTPIPAVTSSQASGGAENLANPNRHGVTVENGDFVADSRPCDGVTGKNGEVGAEQQDAFAPEGVRGDAWEPET